MEGLSNRLKQHIIDWRCYKIYVSHTGYRVGLNCKNIKTKQGQAKHKEKYWQRHTGKSIKKILANHRLEKMHEKIVLTSI